MTQIGTTQDGLVFMLIDTMHNEEPCQTIITWDWKVAKAVAQDIMQMAIRAEKQMEKPT